MAALPGSMPSCTWLANQSLRSVGTRVQSTALLAKTLAASSSPPSVLISGSAVGYYGECGDSVVTESNPAGRDFLAEVALAWEEAAAPARSAGVRLCFARTGIVLSTRGGALAQQLPIFRFGLGGRVGDGSQFWSWISLRDQVNALIWLLDNDLSGPFNLTAPNPVTNSEFTTELGKAVRRPTFLPTPSFALYAKLGRELARALLFTSTRAHPAALEDSGFEFADGHLSDAFIDILGKDHPTRG